MNISYLFLKGSVAALFLLHQMTMAQPKWQNADASFPGLPPSIHVYRTEGTLSGRPNIAWYVEARLDDRSLEFDTDTSRGRRLTPSGFHDRNGNPAVVVNGTFFSFTENRNLNVVMKDGKLLSYNIMSIPGKGKDTTLHHKVTRSAIGIDKRRKADVAWLYTDTSVRYPVAFEHSPVTVTDADPVFSLPDRNTAKRTGMDKRWKMRTAIGGGPVLVHDGKIHITNNEERMFTGKAKDDLHPRTAMGYTYDGRLIILAVEGRRKNIAEGASLTELAEIFLALGAKEALNLDGGGSSCLLVMGKETIKPSDKEGQRAIPGVFLIR